MIGYIISFILIFIQISVIKSCKISDGYRYNENNAEYIKIPMWILIIALIVWIIPYVNVILPAFTLIFVVAFILTEDSVKLVPKGNTIIGKLVKFLIKEV